MNEYDAEMVMQGVDNYLNGQLDNVEDMYEVRAIKTESGKWIVQIYK